mmetsp:Transcript_6528/g.14110  ORF Transcript_6528/g.14110 Transcript_6528/m.14110 type:complete len:86 (+) Transcript_6528:1485-1742(+)
MKSKTINIVVAFASPEISGKLLDNDDLIGSNNEKYHFSHSQRSITLPMKIEAGSDFRTNVNLNSIVFGSFTMRSTKILCLSIDMV